MSNDVFYFSRGFINLNGRICVFAVSKELDEKDKPHAFIGIYNDEKKTWQIWDEGFTLVSAAAGGDKCPRAAALVGRRGNVLSIDCDGKISYEDIKGRYKLPNQYSGLSEVKRVGNTFYAVGMRRQVYCKNVSSGKWKPIDKGVVVERAGEEIAGFLSLDGFDEKEIYSVGYRGDIWRFDGSKWNKIESPTNVLLETITCAFDGQVYIGGDDGTILIGRYETWKFLEQEITDDHIMSSVYFGDRAYFSTETGIIFSFDGKNFEDVTPSDKLKWFGTTGYLASNDKKLLSIGMSDILTFDGKKWRRIKDPKF